MFNMKRYTGVDDSKIKEMRSKLEQFQADMQAKVYSALPATALGLAASRSLARTHAITFTSSRIHSHVNAITDTPSRPVDALVVPAFCLAQQTKTTTRTRLLVGVGHSPFGRLNRADFRV